MSWSLSEHQFALKLLDLVLADATHRVNEIGNVAVGERTFPEFFAVALLIEIL